MTTSRRVAGKTVRRWCLTIAALAAPACGDPLLPADFSGPPEAEVAGTVLLSGGDYQPAARPKLAITWLSSLATDSDDGAALFGQNVSFQRSNELRQDWDIGLSRPVESAETELSSEHDELSLLVGKMVYFDDRDGNGTLDWRCTSASASTCDRVQAISEEFVVYARKPILCEPPPTSNATGELDRSGGRLAEQRLATGYHYFSYRGAVPIETNASEGVRFLVDGDAVPGESELASALRLFTTRLLRDFSLDALGGCSNNATAPALP